MSDLIEFILEIILEGAYAAADSKRVLMWVRIVVGAFLLVFFGGVVILLIIVGLDMMLAQDTKGIMLFILGLGLLLFMCYQLRCFYKKHHVKDELDIE